MEYRVLEYLAHRPRAVVSKTELLEHLYDYNWEKFSNVIEVYISGLRRKIDGDDPVKLIHTMRGHGYVLRGESTPVAIPAKAAQTAPAGKSGEQAKKFVKH
jgi:two-component system response regulator PhoP